MKKAQNISPLDRRLDTVESAFLSILDVKQRILDGIARAVDEVVDPVRSARWQISDLDQPEKTVIGIRVENILRMELELERAEKLDMVVAGENVDVKFTIYSNWQIPPEAVGEICLVTRFRESDHSACAGLIRASADVLNPGNNRDKKRGLNQLGRERIRWLIKDAVADRSIIGFMATLNPDIRKAITDPKASAQTRLNRMFATLQGQPIPETFVEAVAQHKDWTRRLRPDTTNPIAPGHSATGYDVLRQSSAKDRKSLKNQGLSALPPDFCMSLKL